MDIPREQKRTRRLIKRILIVLVLGGGITAITIVLARLEPASPSVERETLLTGTVEQGNMILQVRGVGKLVSEDMLVVPATVSGRVARILVEPGTPVEPNTVILELTNPNLQLAYLEAESNLISAQANLRAEEARQKEELLTKQVSLAQAKANLKENELRDEVNQKQYDDGLISDLEMTLSRSRVENQREMLKIQEQQFDMFKEQIQPALLDAARTSVTQAQSRYNLCKSEVDELKVRAGAHGVLAPIQTRIEPGQQVGQGSILARITNPTRLKAQLHIPQGQARDVTIGLPTEIDTYNGIVSGRVSRIEPTVMEGNVLVDILLEGELPKGARPDLSVVGTIEIDRLIDIFYVGRPVTAAADSRAELFKVVENGKFAERVAVQLGRMSVSTVEVIEGLALGDEIILSDVSQWDTVDRIRLK